MLRIRQDTNEVSGFFYPNYGIMVDFSLYNNEIQPTILGTKWHEGQLMDTKDFANSDYYPAIIEEEFYSKNDISPVFAPINDEV